MEDIRFNGKLEFIIDNIEFVNVLRSANHTVPYKNGKSKYCVILVENGEMNYFFTKDQKTVNLVKETALFIPKNQPYIATYTQDDTIAKVFTFDIKSNALPQVFHAPVYKKASMFSDISKSISGENVNSTVFLASKIYELLYVIQKENVTIPDRYKKIIPALNEIKEFYFQNKKLSYYSDLCYMSESNFRKLFKEYTGKSLVEYRNRIRVSEAYKMINSGEYTVCEAAYLTGFNNMSFFYEVYNRFIV